MYKVEYSSPPPWEGGNNIKLVGKKIKLGRREGKREVKRKGEGKREGKREGKKRREEGKRKG